MTWKTSPLAQAGKENCILVADDEEIVRCLLRRVLEPLGFTVLEAENGEVGWSHFQQHLASIQLVISDIKMPVMDGIQMCNRIIGLAPETTIILISGYWGSEVKPAITFNPNITFIEKPFDIQCLTSRIVCLVEAKLKSLDKQEKMIAPLHLLNELETSPGAQK